MSYINDALQKVQKDKESRYMAYGHIVSTGAKQALVRRPWLSVIGILMVVAFAAGMITFLYWQGDKTIISAKVIAPPDSPQAATPVAAQADASVTSATVPLQNNGAAGQQQVVNPVLQTRPELGIEPQRPEVQELYTKALQRQREGKLEEAKNFYREVADLDPKNVQALNNLGVIHMSQKNYKRAIIRFNEALNVKHDYVEVHYNLACLYAQKNEVAQSLFYLSNAISFNPEVRQWAKSDSDLKALSGLPEFTKLMGKQDH
jgi:tetratricopeptide (TPR) repeat protein